MAKKRKTLPKDFDKLIKAGDIEALKSVFNSCDINAYHGYNKEPALSVFGIPDELVRWLVTQGADINRRDAIYQRTPLHLHAMSRSGDLAVFLELGADINAVDRYGNTPLHMAAGSAFNPQSVTLLLQHGANPLAKDESGRTPLEDALASANNIDIESLVEITNALLKAGTPVTPMMHESVARIGKNFEFHRDNFNKNSVASVSSALSRLYKIFEVAPVEKRIMHDGVSPIVVGPDAPLEQHHALWKLLIPSSGPAKTVQGEVIRITGKVHDEIYRNGAGNWHADFRKMLDALLIHFSSGTPLSSDLLEETKMLIKKIRPSGDCDDEPSRLCELAVKWVQLNPQPVPLKNPPYER